MSIGKSNSFFWIELFKSCCCSAFYIQKIHLIVTLSNSSVIIVNTQNILFVLDRKPDFIE
jgi:hypothetical protein